MNMAGHDRYKAKVDRGQRGQSAAAAATRQSLAIAAAFALLSFSAASLQMAFGKSPNSEFFITASASGETDTDTPDERAQSDAGTGQTGAFGRASSGVNIANDRMHGSVGRGTSTPPAGGDRDHPSGHELVL
ncbi:MAG: hypothetical protein R3316_00755 [Rhodovibrionaceae bacterium]|nr:hypothetical protein [Rhodovibrionaceae bacterium]